MDELHNTGDSKITLFTTNSFERTLTMNRQETKVLFLFDNISRANHSCRPNAVWEWDPQREERGVGTLHALQDMRTGTQIKVDYCPSETDALRTTAVRRPILAANYAFHCDCPACGNAVDDQSRTRAAGLYGQLFTPALQIQGGETDEQSVIRRIGVAEDYIDVLKELKLWDLKLADAYGELADLHERAWDASQNTNHCQTCRDAGRFGIHLDKAVAAATEEWAIHLKCWGPKHPDLKQDVEKLQQRLQKQFQYPRDR
ncbi:hypothetical protein LTR37_008234 [Vermiconidia calcicola]|uniref:Uncharacterized protein n=1 Tax=Vermiconidia calcicola TaxID=1690605 RepID=A0ACC3NBM5_9PEZI|nr:hypothetical protein LTR37_008234 [Vermiconidia calcicola]